MSDYKNSGIVSANKRKRQGKKDPDISGSLDNVVCPHCSRASNFWLSGWLNETDKGKFYGLSVKPKDSANSSRTSARPATSPAPMADDIPF
ncbi:hypothetical protein [Candidatus Binatus sp.]|uniref:hypothetical protein n=1 Tax=Candidatus Binatus sp. TaxID=2811406 RepID=UPI003CC5D149